MKSIDEYVGMITSVRNAELAPAQIHNILMHFQADCFDHAAGLVDECMKDEPSQFVVGNMLRVHARAICPGFQCQSERPVSISSPSNEVEKSDKPPVETVLAEGVVRAGEHVTLNLATGEVKTKPIEADYVPESPESST